MNQCHEERNFLFYVARSGVSKRQKSGPTIYYYTVLAVNAAGEKSAWLGEERSYHQVSATVPVAQPLKQRQTDQRWLRCSSMPLVAQRNRKTFWSCNLSLL